MTNARRRINYVGKIRRDNRVLQEPTKMKEKVARFFENLYSREDFVRPTLDGIVFLL